jgi:hypothetical protein
MIRDYLSNNQYINREKRKGLFQFLMPDYDFPCVAFFT